MKPINWSLLSSLVEITRANVEENTVIESILSYYSSGVKDVAIIGEQKDWSKWRQHLSESTRRITYLTYMQNLEFDPLPKELYNKFDLVISLYTTQQYFGSQETARMFTSNISDLLKKGGRFVCLYHSASEITTLLDRHRTNLYKNTTLQIEKKWHDAPDCFGSAYELTNANNTSYRGYLVFNNVLLTLLTKHGMRPTEIEYGELLDYLVQQPKYESIYYINNNILKNIVVSVKL